MFLLASYSIDTKMLGGDKCMVIKRIGSAGVAHPFGDDRTVSQAFPLGINASDADPFLMCDYFCSVSEDKAADADEFPINWHPHRGFDVTSYLKAGVGRHADSLGNRIVYGSPGMQWMSTGSGIVHAEGGGTENGHVIEGFQIWVNVPSERKSDDPRYGTVDPGDFPVVEITQGVFARILAGNAFGRVGPFKTVQTVQIIDFKIPPNTEVSFDIGPELDTAIVYLYKGSIAQLNGELSLKSGSVVLFDASHRSIRGIRLLSGVEETEMMLFAGKKLNQPIAWRGPIVMTTQQEVAQTYEQINTGTFPPKRVEWDYKRISTKPVM